MRQPRGWGPAAVMNVGPGEPGKSACGLREATE